MQALLSPQAVRRSFDELLEQVRASRFFHDRLSVGLLSTALLVSLFNFVLLAIKVRPLDYPVPIRYSSLTGFDALGSWYDPFFIALFGLGVGVVNGVLAYQAFNRSRLGSFYLLAGSLVVGIFCLVIANAFGAIR